MFNKLLILWQISLIPSLNTRANNNNLTTKHLLIIRSRVQALKPKGFNVRGGLSSFLCVIATCRCTFGKLRLEQANRLLPESAVTESKKIFGDSFSCFSYKLFADFLYFCFFFFVSVYN